MRKAWVPLLLLLLLAAAFTMTGCAAKSKVNSYVLPGGMLGGDTAKDIAPVKNIIVWPMINVASGSKSKGMEVIMTDYLVDTLYLNDSFSSVYILDEGTAKDLMGRTGEELGLKKKPKEPTQGGLVLTKIGQLTGSEALLIGRIDEYDEVKVDKTTYTSVSLSFFLYDAREKTYASLDSFTPVKTLWRTNAVRSAKETPFKGRATLFDTARLLVDDVVGKLENDISRGMSEYLKRQAKKIAGLKKKADGHRGAKEFDEAITAWNEILKLDPESKEAPQQIEALTVEKEEWEEQEKARERMEKIAGIAREANDLEETGDLAAARAKWQEILEIESDYEAAVAKVADLDERIAAEEAAEKEREKAKNLHLAQQALGDTKYTEAIAAARKVLSIEKDNAKAKEIIAIAEQKLEEARAAEEETRPAPVEEAPAAKEEPVEEAPAAREAPVEEAPAAKEEPAEEPEAEPSEGGSSEIESLRNQAMEYFNAEDYENAEKTWKKVLEIDPDDGQAKEMLETTQMLIEALK